MSPHILIIPINVNVNGFNPPFKSHRVAEWFRKRDPSICHLQEIHLSPKDKQAQSEG